MINNNNNTKNNDTTKKNSFYKEKSPLLIVVPIVFLQLPLFPVARPRYASIRVYQSGHNVPSTSYRSSLMKGTQLHNVFWQPGPSILSRKPYGKGTSPSSSLVTSYLHFSFDYYLLLLISLSFFTLIFSLLLLSLSLSLSLSL